MMTYQEILDYAASHGFDIPADCRRLIRQLSALFLVDEGERLRLYGAKREGASTWGAQYGFTFYRDTPPGVLVGPPARRRYGLPARRLHLLRKGGRWRAASRQMDMPGVSKSHFRRDFIDYAAKMRYTVPITAGMARFFWR